MHNQTRSQIPPTINTKKDFFNFMIPRNDCLISIITLISAYLDRRWKVPVFVINHLFLDKFRI